MMLDGVLTYFSTIAGLRGLSRKPRDETDKFRSIRSPFTVMVAVTHPSSYACLLPPAIKAGKELDAKIVLATVVVVPDQLPLCEGARYAYENSDLVARAIATIEAALIPFETVTLVTHRSTQAIANTVLDRHVDLLFAEGHHRNANGHALTDTFMRRISSGISCDLLFVSGDGKPPFQKLLVSVSDPLQTYAALEVAWLLAGDHKIFIEIFHIFLHTADPARKQTVASEIRDQVDSFLNSNQSNHLDVTFKVVEAKSYLESMLAESTGFDCVLVGIGKDGWLKRKLRGAMLGRLYQRLECPMVAMRTGSTIHSADATDPGKNV